MHGVPTTLPRSSVVRTVVCSMHATKGLLNSQNDTKFARPSQFWSPYIASLRLENIQYVRSNNSICLSGHMSETNEAMSVRGM